MAQGTETVTLRLPSGEEVDTIVPAGMSDQEVHELMQMKYPEYAGPPTAHPAGPKLPELAPNPPPPPPPSGSAGSRFWNGVKAGIGGENALNTQVDPNHRFSTNAMIPGSGVYRDTKAGNYAGALGRIAGPAAQLLPFAMARNAEPVYENPIPEVPAPKTAPEYMARPWSGERTGLPYQPNPRYTAPPPPPEPLPPRSGPLLLEGEVAPPLGSPENPGIHSKIPLRVPRSVLEAERAAATPAPAQPEIGTPDNPGPHAKLPMRVPRNVLAEEAEAQAASRGAETNRDATLVKTNIPPYAGEGPMEESPITSETQLSQYGTPKRGRMGPPLRPNVFSSPEDAQIYDNQMSRLGAEAKDAGMYSAARGRVSRIPDYQERIGGKLRPFGRPVDLQEDVVPPPRKVSSDE